MIRRAKRRVRICSPVITTGPVLGTLAQVIADGKVDLAGCVDVTQIREVIHSGRTNRNVSWKLPLLEQVMAGPFSGKESTPYGGGTVHDFMHAKVVVCDDTVVRRLVQPFPKRREERRERAGDRGRCDRGRLAAFVDEVRARYPRVTIAANGSRSSGEPLPFLEARADAGASPGLPTKREPDRHDVLRQAEQLVEDALLVGVADERARETFVDRREQHEHHQRAGVDEPVRHGPRHLDAAGHRQLVRLVVAGVVERLVRREDQVNGRVLGVRAVPCSNRRERSRAARPASVTTTMLPPWLKPPDGARRITLAIRSICSRGIGSGRNARCIRRAAQDLAELHAADRIASADMRDSKARRRW